MAFDRWIYVLRMRLRSLFGGHRLDAELDDELSYHVERLTESHIAKGLRPEDARRAALRAMGGVEGRKEECRDARRVRLLDDLGRDVRHGTRMLARSPGFTAVAILSLSLGIGANTAIFQLIDAVRLRALPVSNPRQLVAIQIANRGWPPGDYGGRYPDLTYPLWERIRSAYPAGQAFSGVLAWGHGTFDLASRGESRFAENGLWVSGEFFQMLGVRPALGRLFTTADDVPGCGAPGVVISHNFWRRWLAGSPSVVGAPIAIKGHSLEVIGVTPPGFFGVEVGRSFDLALPLCADRLLNGDSHRLESRGTWWLAAMGRLRPGWSIAQATAHLDAISPGLFRETVPPRYGADDVKKYLGFRLGALPVASGFSQLRQEYDTPLWLLLAVAGTVLLIACANLANLMLARVSARAREMSVRLALGASRWRLVRQLLVESLLIAAAGAACGIWLAPVLGRSLIGMISSEVSPMFVDLTIDWRLVVFTAALASSTCVLFGLTPALRAARIPPGEAMKGAGRAFTAGRPQIGLRRTLVATQVAFSLALLVVGLLFSRSLFNLLTLDAGFQQSGILQADIDLSRTTLSAEGRGAFRKELIDRIRRIPDVEAVANASAIPTVGRRYEFIFFEGNKGTRKESAYSNQVSPGYFQTLGTSLLAGRDFDDRDTQTSPGVAVVNEAFARKLLNGRDSVGATFRIEGASGEPGPIIQVVGVVENTKYADLREDFKPIIYLAESQNERPGPFDQILIRSTAPRAVLKAGVTRAIETANADVSFHFHDFQAQIRNSLLRDRLLATLCAFFAVLAAALATVGLYGVISYSVAQRSSEIGIRLALGARRRSIVALILREALSLLAGGLAAGLVVALLTGRMATAMLFALPPHDPLTLLAAATLLALTTVAASYLPARRASRSDPLVALRHE